MVKTKVTDIEYFDPCVPSYSGWSETEFDTWDEKELAELWWNFCLEEGLISIDKKEIEEDDYE